MDPVLVAPMVARTQALAGDRAAAEATLAVIGPSPSEGGGHPLPHLVGAAYGALGRESEAMDWLEFAYNQRQSHMAFLRVNPVYEPLRSTPAFEDLIQRMKL